MLFSATMPDEIAKLAMEHMTLPLRIEVAPAGTAAEKVEQEFIIVERRSRFNLLIKLLGEHPTGPVLVFSRTKHGAADIARDLRGTGITSTDIHSNKSLGQRKMALDGFKKGIFRVLVATDIAARGIDVKDIVLVVNYDLPEQSEDYVHRIGRTGRGGSKGKAISFAAPDQKRDILAIERLVKKAIPTKSHEGAKMYEGYSSPRPRGGGYRGRGPSGGFSRGPARSGGSSYAPRSSGGYVGRSSSSSSSSYAPRSSSSSSHAPTPVNKYKAFDKRLTPVGFNKKFRRR